MTEPLSNLKSESADLAVMQRLIQENKRLEVLADQLARQLVAHKDYAQGNYWCWQGDGEDHLESLSCPVLIPASDLRAILARTHKAEQTCAEMRESLESILEVASEIDDETGHQSKHIKHALSSDCGKGYIHFRELEAITDEFRRLQSVVGEVDYDLIQAHIDRIEAFRK